jgi:hypothetical protein
MTRFVAVALVALVATPALADGLTDDEATAWGKKVQETLTARDPAFLDESLDFDAISTRIFVGLPLKDSTKKDFIAGVKDGMQFGGQVVAALGKEGTCKFVRLVQRGDEKVALLRMTFDSGAWTYQEFTLTKNAQGKVGVLDLYSYAMGVHTLGMMRQNVLALAIGEDKELSKRLEGPEAELARHMKDVETISKHMRAQRWADALAACRKLPESLQTTRMILMFEMQSAQNTNEDDYKAVLDLLEKHHGKDPSVALTLFDRALITKDWKKAQASLDAVEKAVGGDPFIDYQRCEVHFAAKELDEAKKAAERALEKEQDLMPAQWSLVTIALEKKEWAGAKSRLETIEKLGVQIGDLTQVEAFSGFVKTKEYDAWMKDHENKK